jgi:hypothetical protein
MIIKRLHSSIVKRTKDPGKLDYSEPGASADKDIYSARTSDNTAIAQITDLGMIF